MKEIKKFSERVQNCKKWNLAELTIPYNDAIKLLLEIEELQKPVPITNTIIEEKKVINSISLDGGCFEL